MALYPAESQGNDRWGRSTDYMKDAVERFSAKWYPYPWPAAINIAGPATGMEYPGIVFDGIDDAGKELFWISAHEIGHSWFPMIVGFDERRHAWRSEEHTSELQSLMRISYAVCGLQKKTYRTRGTHRKGT